MKSLFAFFLAFGLIAQPLFLHGGSDSFAHCDTARFVAVHERMEAFVKDGTIPGAVSAIATHERILSLQTAGFANLSAKEPMRPDTLFWIASMTKPITAVAVLMLQDQA